VCVRGVWCRLYVRMLLCNITVVVVVVVVVGICIIGVICCWALLVLVVWLLVLWIVCVRWLPWLVWVRVCGPRCVGGLLAWVLELWSCVLCNWIRLSCGQSLGRVGWSLVGSRWCTLWCGALLVFWTGAKKRV
jgi:hypothetical protein